MSISSRKCCIGTSRVPLSQVSLVHGKSLAIKVKLSQSADSSITSLHLRLSMVPLLTLFTQWSICCSSSAVHYFSILGCALFSRTWIDVSGQGPKEVANNLKEQGMFLKGNTNDGTFRKLKSLILTAATLGGMCIGVLTIFADLLGAIGSGTGILLTVTIIYGLYE
jgi:protein transport protein SEC61 subunit alpha